ncbi:MAG: four helix bundle protein [Flavobacteriales bacterium CG18_big_fil_WC_8_21_14_2_50_32_9]|jgi:four helix bundle protein|nr:MAG: four helix bundle protein [Flavobacteriales bacterium CG18_big_fil_WC_8_21_14_2_50_32_9]PJC62796.1 MAG: four helix bundle protein [Flavobacteriales bacterium CG_4_9_14_0_2_um_filter_32_27]
MDNKIRSFEDLECWKVCTELRRFVSQLVKTFPKEEQFDLTSQMKRASRSVTHNIAEGYGRFHYQENIQYCRQARGSLYELIDQFIVAFDEKYITNEELTKGKEQINKSLALLNGYIKYLMKAKNEK